MAGKYDIKDVGVLYLDEIPQNSFPTEQASTGILGWDGSNLVVKSDNQGPVYTLVPSYVASTGTLALDPSGQIPAYAPVYDANIGSMTVYDPQATVLVPTYNVATGELVIRDSNNTNYAPRSSTLATNVGVSGFTSVQSPTTETLGAVYLAAGDLEAASCAGYMKLENSGGQNHLKTVGTVSLRSLDGLTTYGTLIQSLAIGAGSVENVIAMTSLVTIPSDGWYRVEATVDKANSTVTLYGLRLGYAG